MNNRQAGLIAAAAFYSGSIGVQTEAVHARAEMFAAHLDEQDKAAQKQAEQEDRQKFRVPQILASPRQPRAEELTIDVPSNRSGEPKSVEQIAEENGRGSFERLTARQAPESKPLDPFPWRERYNTQTRGPRASSLTNPVWAPRGGYELDRSKYPKEQQ